MSNEYHLADGSPRYGSRNTVPDAEATPTPRLKHAARVEETAEAAARLGLDDLAAAIDRRLASSWADGPDSLVSGLRKDHPEELNAARALVKLHWGSQRQWRLKAQVVRDKQLAGTMARRRASGSAREILMLRLVLMGALIALPSYIVATDRENLLKLVLVGVVCIAVALAGGHFITVHARVPVMPNIRSAWPAELREDVIDATLVAILQNKGVDLELQASAAGVRGWLSIQAASRAVAQLRA
ncbi:hypothetical protein ACFVTM_16400 [Arthrobacter sp. NPDC058130]|uniref:hypothetical protein n=1 Tax=Arthrobacter sp. NPDC058130 TaxID=3346353 RepID=UPI0036EDB3E4